MIAKRKARRKEPTGIYNKVRTAEVKKKSFVCVSLSPQKKRRKNTLAHAQSMFVAGDEGRCSPLFPRLLVLLNLCFLNCSLRLVVG